MAWRWGPGPVFAIEARAAARRWQTYATRSGFVGVLLVVISAVWRARASTGRPPTANDLAATGSEFYYGLVNAQLAILLLAAPAATAGAVCLDKARGTLLHLLVTDLSAAEIVLGKLAARLLPVLTLLLAGLPVLAVATLLGGIEPWSVFAAFLVSLGVAVFGCALALLLSVRGKRTQDVLIGTYCLLAIWLLALPLTTFARVVIRQMLGPLWWGYPLPAWLKKANPFWLANAPYAYPNQSDFADALAFLAGALALAIVLIVVAVATVRRVAVRQAAAVARPPRRRRLAGLWRLLPQPSLDFNPVLWREWQRRAPSRWMRAIWFLFGFGATAVAAACLAAWFVGSRQTELPAVANGLIVTLGLLAFSVAAATSLAEERTRGSLDVLLATPLPTRDIVWGKWLATARTAGLLVLLPALSVLVQMAAKVLQLSLENRAAAVLMVALALAQGAALTSLGLALATWLPRVGRAAAWCATGYAAMLLFPPLAAQFFFAFDNNGVFVVVGSPFWGVGLLSEAAVSGRQGQDHFRTLILAGAVVWTGAYLGLAAALQAATLATFDGCLGRVRQRDTPPPVPDAGRKRDGGTQAVRAAVAESDS